MSVSTHWGHMMRRVGLHDLNTSLAEVLKWYPFEGRLSSNERREISEEAAVHAPYGYLCDVPLWASASRTDILLYVFMHLKMPRRDSHLDSFTVEHLGQDQYALIRGILTASNARGTTITQRLMEVDPKKGVMKYNQTPYLVMRDVLVPLELLDTAPAVPVDEDMKRRWLMNQAWGTQCFVPEEEVVTPGDSTSSLYPAESNETFFVLDRQDRPGFRSVIPYHVTDTITLDYYGSDTFVFFNSATSQEMGIPYEMLPFSTSSASFQVFNGRPSSTLLLTTMLTHSQPEIGVQLGFRCAVPVLYVNKKEEPRCSWEVPPPKQMWSDEAIRSFIQSALSAVEPMRTLGEFECITPQDFSTHIAEERAMRTTFVAPDKVVKRKQDSLFTYDQARINHFYKNDYNMIMTEPPADELYTPKKERGLEGALAGEDEYLCLPRSQLRHIYWCSRVAILQHESLGLLCVPFETLPLISGWTSAKYGCSGIRGPVGPDANGRPRGQHELLGDSEDSARVKCTPSCDNLNGSCTGIRGIIMLISLLVGISLYSIFFMGHLHVS